MKKKVRCIICGKIMKPVKYMKNNHKHHYYKNEDKQMECARCGLLKTTIEDIESIKCLNCGKKLKPILDKNKKWDGHSYCCECMPKKLISYG